MASYKVTLINEGEDLNSTIEVPDDQYILDAAEDKVLTFLIPAELEHVQHVLEKLLQVVLISLIKVSWMTTN